MEEYIEVSAKTKEEAIMNAAIQLGTSSDNIEYDVIQEATSGLFGIGRKPAIIRARIKKALSVVLMQTRTIAQQIPNMAQWTISRALLKKFTQRA